MLYLAFKAFAKFAKFEATVSNFAAFFNEHLWINEVAVGKLYHKTVPKKNIALIHSPLFELCRNIQREREVKVKGERARAREGESESCCSA
jgi:hypothetical protein